MVSKDYKLNIAALVYDFDSNINQMLNVILTNMTREFISEISKDENKIQLLLQELNNCGLTMELSIKPTIELEEYCPELRDKYHQVCYKCKQTIIIEVNNSLIELCPKCNTVLNWEIWLDEQGRKRVLLKP